MKKECPVTAPNSEYPAAAQSAYAQIGSRWPPTSGTRRTLSVMPDYDVL